MSTSSPLIFQKNTVIEKHQVEGNDPPGRSFSRMVPVTRTATGYTARVQYESVTAETPSLPTIAEALRYLAGQLQKMAFSRLRTRLNFRGKKYYAEKEAWVDYPDPT
ncbi:MAG: hypothetical protein EPO02_10015 [Nitrospirae bacterium]|nr:MAG: hypothetical protein EPO02_10015 [Nitrospirota bacterium]